MAGLDKTSMPFSAKPPDEYINGQSRLSTTQQMRSILENSRLDESVLSADYQPAHSGRRAGSAVKLSTDPTLQYTHDQPTINRNGLPGSKFDELYRQALRNTESILSDSGNPPDGHVMLQHLHSPVRSTNYEVSDNDSHLDVSVMPPGLHPTSKYLDSAKRVQNGHLLTNDVGTPEMAGEASDAVHSEQSHHSERRDPSTSRRSQDVDRSDDSGRVDETEISEEYTTEEDDIEEVQLNSQ